MGRTCFRIMALLVAVLLTVGSVTVSAHAEPAREWGVYRMAENESGVPIFKTPPAYTYTENGLRVTPSEGMDSYTVQSEQVCSLNDGFFMELELDNIALSNMLLLHIWDQSGVMIGNLHCGSGWYCLIVVDKNGNDYMMSLRLWEYTDTLAGGSEILGTMAVKTNITDGAGLYSLTVADGALRLNGSMVPGSEDAIQYLKEVSPSGDVYVGMTLMATDVGQPLSAMTMTRFGRDEATATIVGTDVIPETAPPSAETAPDEPDSEGPAASSPADTVVQDDPKDSTDATDPADPTRPTDPSDSDEPTDPDATTRPEQGVPGASDSTADPSKPSVPGDPTEPTRPAEPSESAKPAEPNESRPDGGEDDPSETNDSHADSAAESETLSTADRLMGVYGEAVSFCQSSMGMSGVVCVAVMGAAFILLRKKH